MRERKILEDFGLKKNIPLLKYFGHKFLKVKAIKAKKKSIILLFLLQFFSFQINKNTI